MGVQIVGVSFDSVGSLQNWADDEGFQFELWEDQDKDLAIHYGAASQSSFFPSRISFLLDRSGEVLLEYTKDISVGTHPGQVLQDCKLLFGEE